MDKIRVGEGMIGQGGGHCFGVPARVCAIVVFIVVFVFVFCWAMAVDAIERWSRG